MKSRAQSTMEYVVVMAVVAAAVFAMSAYVKRSIQGKLRTNAEDLRGSGGSAYSPQGVILKSTLTKSVAESSHSYTELSSTSEFKIDRTNVTTNKAAINLTTKHEEEIVPFSQEPVR